MQFEGGRRKGFVIDARAGLPHLGHVGVLQPKIVWGWLSVMWTPEQNSVATRIAERALFCFSFW